MSEDPWAGMYENPWAVKRIQLAVEMARLTPGGYVLELGCYRHEVKRWLPPGVAYTGVDQQAYVPDTVVMDFDRDPLVLLKVPKAIFCLETLEHLKQPELLLRRLVAYAQADRIPLILSLPNEATLFHRLRALTGILDPMAFQPGKHLHLPNVTQTVRWLESQGLVIEAMRPYIDLSAAKSTHPWVGRLMQLIPELVWMGLARWSPNLFARGMVYRCTVRQG